jgi:hypothetical protein
MIPPRPPDDQFKVRKFVKKRRDLRNIARYQNNPGLLLPRPDPHYHVLYNTLPDFTIGYETQGLVMQAIKDAAKKHEEALGEDKVIYYEEGLVQLVDAKIRDRTGVFRIMVQPGECHSTRCINIIKIMTREDRQ